MQAFTNPTPGHLGDAQHEVLFAALTVSHRRAAGAGPQPAATSSKVARLSCCCRLSELMPLVRQMHDTARAARLARELVQVQQAA